MKVGDRVVFVRPKMAACVGVNQNAAGIVTRVIEIDGHPTRVDVKLPNRLTILSLRSGEFTIVT
ncbi:hypothetical protein [Methylobacterium gnaphalii]|uniref:KOW domain-containing protein n=1 Tax=Methylobacterium gnaphalii TaxID=1010610 RepID=A0A512JQL1_9HYPH|nr:hypothetical protein [Methylobacterium gnaphalii]GEP12244.1 hypothetical protein MGN01_40890 [Methylobacterium gnaphalii]GJD68752.1 hypothetical protein MMMDOFMJ_1676 [Methylobacterium gnaphalii]